MKIASYPIASFTKALELTKTVSDLGGNCAHSTCAAKMGKQVSGAFKDLISATVKYGLITNKRGMLTITESYTAYKLSYDKAEENKHLRALFLKPQLFQDIYEKYKNVPLPIDILEKALIKEFGVPEKHASRVTTYFMQGAKLVGLLNENNTFTSDNPSNSATSVEQTTLKQPNISSLLVKSDLILKSNSYSVQVLGPDIDTKFILSEESDFSIVTAILAKVKNKVIPSKV